MDAAIKGFESLHAGDCMPPTLVEQDEGLPSEIVRASPERREEEEMKRFVGRKRAPAS